MEQQRDFQKELKEAQGRVKNLGGLRDKLIGDVRAEEVRVSTAVSQLTSLGVENADKLTVKDLEMLRDSTRAALEADLTTLQGQISQAEAVMAEYQSIAQ